MDARRFVIFGLCIGALCISATDLYAQSGLGSRGNRQNYSPAKPTLSPYLNLTNPDTGPLPNYFSLARPQLQQREINNRQNLLTQQQQGEINQIDQNLSIHNPTMKATGTGAGFMNHGRYYSSMGANSAGGKTATAGKTASAGSASAGRTYAKSPRRH